LVIFNAICAPFCCWLRSPTVAAWFAGPHRPVATCDDDLEISDGGPVRIDFIGDGFPALTIDGDPSGGLRAVWLLAEDDPAGRSGLDLGGLKCCEPFDVERGHS
jgi:hypothetical protein